MIDETAYLVYGGMYTKDKSKRVKHAPKMSTKVRSSIEGSCLRRRVSGSWKNRYD